MTVTVFCCESLRGIDIFWCFTMFQTCCGQWETDNWDIPAASLPPAAPVSCNALIGFNTPPVARVERQCVTSGTPQGFPRSSFDSTEWSKPRANSGCTLRISEAQREWLKCPKIERQVRCSSGYVKVKTDKEKRWKSRRSEALASQK